MCNTSLSEYMAAIRRQDTGAESGDPQAGRHVDRRASTPPTIRWPAPRPTGNNSPSSPWKKLTALSYHWVHDQPDVMAKAMVLANDRLFIAGPRDVVDEKQMSGRSNEKAFQEKMARAGRVAAGRARRLRCRSSPRGRREAGRIQARMPAGLRWSDRRRRQPVHGEPGRLGSLFSAEVSSPLSLPGEG